MILIFKMNDCLNNFGFQKRAGLKYLLRPVFTLFYTLIAFSFYLS